MTYNLYLLYTGSIKEILGLRMSLLLCRDLRYYVHTILLQFTEMNRRC